MDEVADLINVTFPEHYRVFRDRIWNMFSGKRAIDLLLDLPGGSSASIGVHRLVLELFLPKLTGLLDEADDDSDARPDYGIWGRGGGTIRRVGCPALGLSDDCGGGLELLVEFVYRGTVDVTRQQLYSLRRIAGLLQVPLEVDAEQEARTLSSLPPPVVKRRNTRAPANKRKGTPVKVVAVVKTETEDAEVEGLDQKPELKRKATRSQAWSGGSTTEKPRAATRKRRFPESEVVAAEDPLQLGDVSNESCSSKEEREEDEEDDIVGLARKRRGRPKKTTTAVRKKKAPKSSKKSSQAGVGLATNLKPKEDKVSRAQYRRTWLQSQPLLKCQHCGYETHGKLRLAVHVNSKHDSSVPVFKCRTCHRPFQMEDSLRRHEATHQSDGQVVYRCSLCPYSSPKQTNYRRHLTSSHRVGEDGQKLPKRFECAQCDFSCIYRSQMRYHTDTRHVDGKRFKCVRAGCAYASVRKGDLDKHVSLVHKKLHACVCETCGYKCLDIGGLNRHRRTHTGERPYVCATCGKAYANNNKLKLHVQQHVKPDDKPFCCHLCGHACRRSDNLQMHMRRIHKLAPEKESSSAAT